MELATKRPELIKPNPDGEGDNLILLNTDVPFDRLIRNIVFAKMLGRKAVKQPKYHRDLTAIANINYGLIDKTIHTYQMQK